MNLNCRLGKDYKSDQSTPQFLPFNHNSRIIDIFGAKDINWNENLLLRNHYETPKQASRDLKEIHELFTKWRNYDNSIKEIEDYIETKDMLKPLKEEIVIIKKNFKYDYFPKWKKKIEELEISSNPLKFIKNSIIENEKFKKEVIENQQKLFNQKHNESKEIIDKLNNKIGEMEKNIETMSDKFEKILNLSENKYLISERVNSLFLSYLIKSSSSESRMEFKEYIHKSISKEFIEISSSDLYNDEKILELEKLIQVLSKTFEIESLKKQIEQKILSLKEFNRGILFE